MLQQRATDLVLALVERPGQRRRPPVVGGIYQRGPDGRVTGDSQFRPFVAAMKDIGYQGYMSYELCGPPRAQELLGLERAEMNAQLAAEFMRGLIQEAGAAETSP